MMRDKIFKFRGKLSRGSVFDVELELNKMFFPPNNIDSPFPKDLQNKLIECNRLHNDIHEEYRKGMTTEEEFGYGIGIITAKKFLDFLSELEKYSPVIGELELNEITQTDLQTLISKIIDLIENDELSKALEILLFRIQINLPKELKPSLEDFYTIKNNYDDVYARYNSNEIDQKEFLERLKNVELFFLDYLKNRPLKGDKIEEKIIVSNLDYTISKPDFQNIINYLNEVNFADYFAELEGFVPESMMPTFQNLKSKFISSDMPHIFVQQLKVFAKDVEKSYYK